MTRTVMVADSSFPVIRLTGYWVKEFSLTSKITCINVSLVL